MAIFGISFGKIFVNNVGEKAIKGEKGKTVILKWNVFNVGFTGFAFYYNKQTKSNSIATA